MSHVNNFLWRMLTSVTKALVKPLKVFLKKLCNHLLIKSNILSYQHLEIP